MNKERLKEILDKHIWVNFDDYPKVEEGIITAMEKAIEESASLKPNQFIIEIEDPISVANNTKACVIKGVPDIRDFDTMSEADKKIASTTVSIIRELLLTASYNKLNARES